MPDRDKVIKGLEVCTKDIPMSNAVHKDDLCKECPYYNAKYSYCWNQIVMMRDALALLKEQEAVEPTIDEYGNKRCGYCGHKLQSIADLDLFCCKCGKPVLWEGR